MKNLKIKLLIIFGLFSICAVAQGASYPPNIDYGKEGDFIAKRGTKYGRAAILVPIGPVLVSQPEAPGSSSRGIPGGFTRLNNYWDLSDLTNPVEINNRFCGGSTGITCGASSPINAHATVTSFIDGKAYQYVPNPWQAGRMLGFDPNGATSEQQLVRIPRDNSKLAKVLSYSSSTSREFVSLFWTYGNNPPAKYFISDSRNSNPDFFGSRYVEWDHFGLTGVTGFPIWQGHLLIFVSDQASTGIAVYDVSGYKEGKTPKLLSTFKPQYTQPDGSKIGLGGYWAEPYGTNKVVFAARKNSSVKRTSPAMYVVDFSDPAAPKTTCEVYFDQDQTHGRDGDNSSDPMYVNFQDQYAFVDHFKVDIEKCEQEYAIDQRIDSSEIPDIVFRFNDTENSCDGSQYYRPLGQVGVLGGYNFFRTTHKMEYRALPGNTRNELLGSFDQKGQKGFYFNEKRELLTAPISIRPGLAIINTRADIKIGDRLTSPQDPGNTYEVTKLIVDESINEQGLCFMVAHDEPDTRAPYISGHIPRANATNVPVDSYVHIHIPETLRAETAADAFRLINTDTGEEVEVWSQLSHTGTIAIRPEQDLELDVTYRVDVAAGIQDYMGNVMGAYSFSFTTGDEITGPVQNQENGWVSCANEGQSCTVPSGTTGVVRYGVGDQYFYQENVSGSISCSNGVFGDPYPFKVKSCDYLAAEPAQDYSGTPYYPNQSSQLSCQDESVQDNLWVVNPDNDSISVVDTVLDPFGKTVLTQNTREVFLNYEKPTSVTQVAGQYAITYQNDDKVVFHDAQTADPVYSVDTGHGSQPVASVLEGDSLYVALYGSGEVVRIDTRTRQITERVAVGPKPKAMAISNDGQRLLVTRFISPSTHAEVYDLDISSGLSLSRTITVNKVFVPDDIDVGSGVPNFLSSIVIDPNDERAYIAAVKSNVDRGLLQKGVPLDSDNTVRAIMVELDLVNDRDANVDPDTVDGTLDFDNAADPTGITLLADGSTRIVSFQGNNLVQATSQRFNTTIQLKSGFGPQDMCTTLRTMYVKNFTGRGVSAIDVARYLEEGFSSQTFKTIETVSDELLSSEQLRGLQVFYHSSQPQMGEEGYMSCASCHKDGAHDGQTWDLTSLGEGLRNTISLNGTGGTRFGRLHWSQNFDEVQDFELQIEELNGGIGLIDGKTFNGESPLDLVTSNRSDDLDALASYVASLGKSSLKRSPYRTYTGELSASAKQGRLVFEQKQCASCHAGKAFRDGESHDVGTIKASSGSRLSGQLNGIRTPTLVELFDSAPYFHDGSAATLDEVLETGAHDVGLSRTEKENLVEYLLSIDRDMFIDDDTQFPDFPQN